MSENLNSGENTTVTPQQTPETSPPEKRRGPGRPRKEEQVNSPPSPTLPKKPGRPKGSGSKKIEPIDSEILSKQIAGLHMMIAQISQIPEIMISEEESKMLASSVALVCDEYDLNLSGKTGAFLQLMASAAVIYLPRVPVIQQRVREKRDMKNALPTEG